MREIKFRAWDNKHKRMFGNYHFEESCRGLVEAAKALLERGDIPSGLFLALEDKNLIFMQYTGLKDISGQEIYEGDICKSYADKGEGKELIGVIDYNQPTASFIAKIIDSDEEVFHYSCLNEGNVTKGTTLKYTEVIGNIYENPELLEADYEQD